MSTLLTTASTSVRGFPERLAGLARDQVGEARPSGRATTLAKRRSVSIRTASGLAAQPAQAARARGDLGVGVAGSSPVHRMCAGGGFDQEVMALSAIGRVCMPASVPDFSSCAWSGQATSVARMRLAHPPDRGDLGVERGPVVRLVDPRPDRLDLVDMHRAGRLVRPIRMVERASTGVVAVRSTARKSAKASLSYASSAGEAPRRRPPRQSKKKRSIVTVLRRQRRLDRDRASASVALAARRARCRAGRRSRRAAPAWKSAGKASSAGVSASASAIRPQRDGELDHVPVDRLGLAAEGIEAGMVEIGGGEMRRPRTASSATGRNRSSRR